MIDWSVVAVALTNRLPNLPGQLRMRIRTLGIDHSASVTSVPGGNAQQRGGNAGTVSLWE